MGGALETHPRVGGERGLSSFELAESLRAIPAAAGNILFFTGLGVMLPSPQPARGPDQAGPALNFRPHSPPHPGTAADGLPTRRSDASPEAVRPAGRT